MDVVEGTPLNRMIQSMTMIDQPRVLFGRYEYVEELVTGEPRHGIVGYLDHNTRIVKLYAGGQAHNGAQLPGGDDLLAVAKLISRDEPTSSSGSVGIEFDVVDYVGGVRTGAYRVGCTKIGGVESFWDKLEGQAGGRLREMQITPATEESLGDV